MTNLPLTITDPTVYQYIYYLRKAVNDAPEQLNARQRVFIREAQQIANTLREFLGLPIESLVLDEEISGSRHKMVLRYNSGSSPWQGADSSFRAWLTIYEASDSYIIRTILCQLGQELSADVFHDLQRHLPWRPEGHPSEWLGQSIFYAGLTTVPPQELAQSILGTPTLWHTVLTCGELYCQTTLNTPNVLVFTSPQHEPMADEFFGQMAMELGWYLNKGMSQEKQYESSLQPFAEDMERSFPSLIDHARMLHAQIIKGDKDFDTLKKFHQQIEAIENLIFQNEKQYSIAQAIIGAIQINVENYRQITTTSAFLNNSAQDEVFTQHFRYLQRIPRQIQNDLQFWQPIIEQAHRSLNILRKGGSIGTILPHPILHKKIVDFLTSLPNIDDTATQRALIYSSGLDEELENQIYFVSSAAQFFQLLVRTLSKYGKLKDGRNALEAVLESAKRYIGQDKKEYCDKIISQLISN